MQSPLKRVTFSTLTMLAAQLVLGVFAATLIELPESAGQAARWQAAFTSPVVALHILLAIGLVANGVMVLVRLRQATAPSRAVVAAWVGLVASVLATAFGAEYVRTNQEAASMAMGLAFLAAAVAYGWIWFKYARQA